MLANFFPKPVGPSSDLDRIKALPNRHPSTDELEHLTRAVTHALRLPGSSASLRPKQAQALYEASRQGGLLAPMGVGSGKTLLDILMPMVMPGCKTAVLLVPAPLKAQLNDNWAYWATQFKVPNLPPKFTPGIPTTYIVSYHELQNYKATELLEQYRPDLILCDEAHFLRYKGSSRTKRVLRYVANHPETRVCCWSGTLTNKSLKDYAHLSAICLKLGSPLPVHWGTVDEWAKALDANPKGLPAPPGALETLCSGSESARDAFKRRFLSTPGVVATKEDASEVPLYILERKIDTPEVVSKALRDLRQSWVRPDGEEFYEATQVAACARQMASGFYYRWRYPRREPKALIEEWLDIRAKWHRELRKELRLAKPHLDSPKLLMMAAIRQEQGYTGPLPKWESEFWAPWHKIHKQVRPVKEAVWLSEFLLSDCVKVEKGSLIWYEHEAFEDKLKGVVPTFGAGDDAIRKEKGDRTVAACIRAHGTGKELQMFSTNIMANYPSAHAAWEQLIGRTDRPGQEADAVTVTLYRHTPELRAAFDTALEYARYTHGTHGTPQKLLSASYGFQVDV